MLLYVGPDQVVPAMSVLATIMGFLMIFWNKAVAIFRRIFGLSKPPEPEVPPTEGTPGES